MLSGLGKIDKNSIVVSLLILGVGMTRILWGLLNCVDIPFGDDSMYLAFSRNFPKIILPDYGPLYVAGYKFFRMITHNDLVAYRMGMFAHVMIPTLALYVSAILFRVPPVLAAIAAIAFLSNPMILDYGFFNPMVSHPAIAWIFLWMGLVWRKTPFFQLISALVLSLVIVYYRPEHILTMFMIMSILAVWMLLKHKELITLKNSLIIGLALVLIAGTFKIVGKPVGHSGKRSGLAFIQHVGINYLQWKGNPHPWEDHVYFTDYLPEMLGSNSTLENIPADPKALLQNSKPLLITHFSYNLKGFLQHWLKTPALLLPAGIPFWIIYCLDALILLVFALILLLNRQKIPGWWQSFWAHYGMLWLILAAFAATSKAVSILVYPRVHYFLFSLPFFYFSTWLIMKWGRILWPFVLPRKDWIFAALALTFLFAAPNVCSKSYMKVGGPDQSSTHIPAIETLWKQNITDSVRILDREMGIFLYLPGNYRYIDFNKDKPFMQYVNSRQINMIHVTPTLLKDKHYTEDPEFGFFRNNLALLGWKTIPVTGTAVVFWVKEDLLP